MLKSVTELRTFKIKSNLLSTIKLCQKLILRGKYWVMTQTGWSFLSKKTVQNDSRRSEVIVIVFKNFKMNGLIGYLCFFYCGAAYFHTSRPFTFTGNLALLSNFKISNICYSNYPFQLFVTVTL